jgi:hypothetical protein
MIENALSERGFSHMLSDEPHVDCWINDLHSACEILAECEDGKWTIARSPRRGEPHGEWHIITRGLKDDDALLLVDRLLGTARQSRMEADGS